MTVILDGKGLSEKILDGLAVEIKENGYTPTLAVVLVGNNPASEVYVSVKEKACKRIGINSVIVKFDDNVAEKELLNKIEELNNDSNIDGILVQLPLPKHINNFNVINKISPDKDVDGFTVYNVGCIALGVKPYCYPCTPKGILKIFDEYGINVEGKNVTVIGRSNIVGKPMANLLLNLNATVTHCHSKTLSLEEKTKNADIIISAVGNPKFITADMVKDNAVVIDVGIFRLEGKLVGDIDFETVSEKASYITPVPKGVGPMTIASLMENTVELYKLHKGI